MAPLDEHNSNYLREKLKVLGFSSYSNYFFSPRWKRFTEWYSRRVRLWGCAACGKTPAQLHHKTYKNLGNEKPSDVVFLCGTCHSAVHVLAGTLGSGALPKATKDYIRGYRKRGNEKKDTKRVHQV